MLFYKIPSDIYDSTKAIPDFTQAFLDVEQTNPLIDSCLFEIKSTSDSREHLLSVQCVYLVIPDFYEIYFQPLLSKYGAMKLDSLPSFNRIAFIAGDENAIDKIAR